MPPYGGTSRGMKKFLYGFVHSGYREKAGATPGANIRKYTATALIPVGTRSY